MTTLIRSPSAFFEEFSADSGSWVTAATGYYAVSLAETFQNILVANGVDNVGLSLARASIVNLVSIPVGMLLWGVLWVWLGSRVFRGRAGLPLLVKATGYALLPAGLVGALILCTLQVLEPSIGSTGLSVHLLIYLALALILAGLGLAYCWKAVRVLNGFSRLRTLGSFLVLPALGFLWILIDEFLLG